MKPAPNPENEVDRIAVLHGLKLLDTPRDSSFDAITKTLLTLCDMPMSFVCLVDSERVWMKSNQGLEDANEIPREIGFCPYTINQTDIFEVKDALLDDRFSDSPIVIGQPKLRYYAGAPLITQDGFAIGTLCVMDFSPRELNTQQREYLKSLADNVTALIELKKLKESKRLSLEHRLSDVLEVSLNEIYLVNSETEKFVYANRAAQKSLGYSLNQLKQLQWQDVFHDLPEGFKLSKISEPLCNKFTAETFESSNIRKDGSNYPVDTKIQMCCIENNEYLIVCNDITQRKISEQESLNNEKRYHEIFLNAPDAIFIHNPSQHKFIDCNKVVADLLGYSREEILKLGPKDVTPEYQPNGIKTEALVKEVDKKILATGKPVRVEHTFLSKSGEVIPCEVTVSRHPISERFLTVATVYDIRARKELELREKELMNNLANIMRINSMFALSTGLAHELNQPLTAIMQYCDTALSTLNNNQLTDDTIKQSIKGAHSQSIRAAEIIKNTRRLIGRHEYICSTIHIDRLINETIQLVELDLTKHNIEINIEVNSALPHLIADQAQLQQVLLNLIRNSIEAMEHQQSNKKITIECYPHQYSMVEFSIKDTGPGIPKGMLNNLISPRESSKPDGLGMGLCICNFIITSKNGSFWHDENYTHGTHIKFRIPLQQDSDTPLKASG